MAYQTKTWKARSSEFPTRRTLTDTSTGMVTTVNVARAEGTVTEQGDGFSAANMNDLEARVKAGFDGLATVANTGVYSDLTGKPVAGTDYAVPSKTSTVTLTVAGWSSNTQTVNVAGVTASNLVLVNYAPASRAAWIDADIYCSAQGAGTLTFTCDSTPTEAITANVAIVG